jgi:hypothetical protein
VGAVEVLLKLWRTATREAMGHLGVRLLMLLLFLRQLEYLGMENKIISKIGLKFI